MHQRQMLRLNDNCAVFEAWANMFLFFVYETRFFFVCFCFVKLRQTAGIVDDMTCATMLVSLSKHARASSR